MEGRAFVTVSAISVFLLSSVTSSDCGRKAVCYLQHDPLSTQKVSGVISFAQASENELISISVNVTGLDSVPSGSDDSKYMHGFHVHHYGDITGGCKSTGGHFNPLSAQHGAPTAMNRHVGDFGNIRQDANGEIVTTFTDSRASLFGSYSIFGRAIVLHAGQDDLGLGGDASSLANGNAGSRLGCCVIGWAAN